MLSVVQISEWPEPAIEALVRESEQEGFRFLRRLQEEWRAGTNRFSRPGEAFFGVFEDKRLLAVGGINRESGERGRLRRFYVRQADRRRGIGRLLAAHLLRFASQHYGRVVLRTDTPTADRFYVSMGFIRLPPGDRSTHTIETKKEPSLLPTPRAD